jgi:hypothetical protein
MNLKIASIGALLCAGVLSANSAFAALANNAEVFLKSDPGSYVGGGIGAPSVTWVHGIDGIFDGEPNYGSFLRGVNIAYHGDAYWNFEFSAPSYDPTTNTNNGQMLQVGLYTNAQRFPFNSPTKPGIDISGNGRGNNTESGWFDILQISYDPSGNLSQFAVDFKQFDEGNTTVGLYGSLRFNSTIPIDTSFSIPAVPEPGTLTLMMLGAAALVARRVAPSRRRAT